MFGETTAGSAACGRRPHPERLAVGRGDARLHRVRAREMGRAGQQLGLEGSQ